MYFNWAGSFSAVSPPIVRSLAEHIVFGFVDNFIFQGYVIMNDTFYGLELQPITSNVQGIVYVLFWFHGYRVMASVPAWKSNDAVRSVFWRQADILCCLSCQTAWLNRPGHCNIFEITSLTFSVAIMWIHICITISQFPFASHNT